MTSDRPYRQGKPPWVALKTIRKSAGQQFNPVVVRTFETVFQEKFQVDEIEVPDEGLTSYVSPN
jgi:HD-GYP domain-containing protein (c-di-GMP phosphodiesterase class II)